MIEVGIIVIVGMFILIGDGWVINMLIVVGLGMFN